MSAFTRKVGVVGFLLSVGYVLAGGVLLRGDPRMAAGLFAIGLYGLVILARYRRQIVAA